MAEHTPAPWIMDKEGNIWSPDDYTTAVAMANHDGTGIDVYKAADLALMLAAPDMYEALCSVHAYMDSRGMQDVGVYGVVCRALDKVWNEEA